MAARHLTIAAVTTVLLLASVPAYANGHCLTKGAIATAESEKSAKWYALETMVQAVSWGLWPNFVATNQVEGYTVTNEKYKCTTEGGAVTCTGRATFCKKGG
jgi:hypothetical protein